MSDTFWGPDDGTVLPEQTSDDTDLGWGDESTEGPDVEDDRILREVPPHHGD